MKKGHLLLGLKKAFRALMVAMLALPAIDAQATNLSISTVPLYLGGAVEPNIMFTLDDSGSMFWSYMPDSIFWDGYSNRAKASEFNGMAYNPHTTYAAPVDAYGNSLGDASFTSAWDDGYNKGTCSLDLSTSYRPTWDYGDNYIDGNCDGSNLWGWEYVGGAEPAYYYTYYTNHPAGPQSQPSGCSNNLNDDDCYLKVVVGPTSGVGGTDERTNFANWYSYYRRRIYTAKAAIGRAFAQQGTGMRVGFGAINNGLVSLDGVNTRTVSRGVRHFNGQDREDFFSLLYAETPTGVTPLRRAADDVGQYFSRTDAEGPWSETPGQTGGQDFVCRQSYHIIMSDGYWTDYGVNYFYSGYPGDAATTAAARANNDGTDGPTIGSYTYSAVSPFSDDVSNTLADVAMYYWKRDLNPNMDDNVPTVPEDPAFWQHLVTFTVGLGVEGTVSPDAAFAAIDDTNTTINWPNPAGGGAAKIDDMLHAAVNGRGGFFSAKDPDAFATALGSILKNIASRTSSASSVALNSGSLFGGSFLFQARFNTQTWDGEVLAYAIQSNGSVASSPSWNAASNIPTPNNRRILTFDGNVGIPFRWSDLSAAQQAALGGQQVLDFLRGDRSNEAPNGSLRTRTSVLGDIIDSAPLFVGPPKAGYPDYWGASQPENSKPYSGFVTSKSTRPPMVFVGANDGMLHMFDATDGTELAAYVPSVLMPNLPALSVQGYAHKWYVDGSPVSLDAFFQSDSDWHTVLAGGLNAGGQGIYALDITNAPTTSDTELTLTGTTGNRVLWEFTDADDADLGFTYSRPNIVRLANGVWGAIFGNGYGNTSADGHASSTGDAVLYVVNIETGALIAKIDTKTSSADDPTGANRPNGLSSVAPVDVDGDYIVDYVYGGDLFGNLWKFDLSDTNSSNWAVVYGNSNNPKPLFVARADQSDPTTAQPITVRPQVGRHESGYGYMVYFGTGKYIEVGDDATTNQDTQTFYAVWDQNDNSGGWTVLDRTALTAQSILTEVSSNGYDYRLTSDVTPVWDDPKQSGVQTYVDDQGVTQNTSLGWYMDLYNTNFGTSTANYGERQVTDPLLRQDRIIFTSLLPSGDPCTFGGSGWLMELEAATGKRLPFSPFDTNQDGIFAADDNLSAGVDLDGDGNVDVIPGSGKKSKVGILPSPAVITDKPHAREFKYESGSSGQIEVTTENPGPQAAGRTSWLELIQ